MKPDIKQQWVDALTSGEFEQGHEVLRQTHDDGAVGFCCLGVLCELHRRATNGAWDLDRYMGAETLPPDAVVKWAGLQGEEDFKIRLRNGRTVFLTDANDGLVSTLSTVRQHTFREIAALIKDQY